jgi:RHS repeat-associated protein
MHISILYEPTFNLVTIVVDPQGNQTTTDRDACGNPVVVTDPAGVRTRKTYDSRGLITSLEAGAGTPEAGLVAFKYDDRGNLRVVIDPLGRRKLLAQDGAGNVRLTMVGRAEDNDRDERRYRGRARDSDDTDGIRITAAVYDAMNRLVALTNAKGDTTRYRYDAGGNLIALVDAKDHATTFSYDVRNRLATTRNALDQTQSFSRDPNGNVVSTTLRDGRVISYQYDAANQLIGKTLPPPVSAGDPQITAYSYDEVGQMIAATTTETAATFAYDGAGHLLDTQVLLPAVADALTITYAYDLNGNRISLTDPMGTTTTYTYDGRNQLTAITSPFGQSLTFVYDALGRRTAIMRPNGAVSEYRYDAASQLLSLTHRSGISVLDAEQYTYDIFGQRTSRTDHRGVTRYRYDALGQLTRAATPSATIPLESYRYDDVGNRTESNQTGRTVVNAANQTLEDARFRYAYDANGNRVRRSAKGTGATTTYEFDAENRLVRVALPDGSAVEYTYDGLGRRVRRGVEDATGDHYVAFLYDQDDVLLEISGIGGGGGGGGGPAIDVPAFFTATCGGALVFQLDTDHDGRPDHAFFYLADGVGSTTALIDLASTVNQRYDYSSFGHFESLVSPALVPQPFTFQGRGFENETGLFNLGGKSFDDLPGLFLQEGSPDFSGMNGNSLAGNDPVNLTDPGGDTRLPLLAMGIKGQPGREGGFSKVRSDDPIINEGKRLGGRAGKAYIDEQIRALKSSLSKARLAQLRGAAKLLGRGLGLFLGILLFPDDIEADTLDVPLPGVEPGQPGLPTTPDASAPGC